MITDVAGHNLCIGCGICQGACPTQCIKMTDRNSARIPRPTLDRALCTQCGNCLEVCPGIERLPRSEVETARSAFERYCGSAEGCFVIDASEQFKTRYTASGGFVTALLSYLLDSNRIDGALVVKPREGNPDR